MEIDQKFNYHSVSQEKAAERLGSDPDWGISHEEAEKRKEQYGANKLPEKGRKTAWEIFIKQFKDFLILILAIAAVISWIIGEMADVYIIAGVILFNAIMGFVQEYRAEKAIQSIKKLVKHNTNVIRSGEEQTMESEEVVPGDLIVLKEGMTVPADAKLIKAKNLRTIEASLTGESVPSEKATGEEAEDAPLGDRSSMVFKGTQVARGSGKALVTATGLETEIGSIAGSLTEMETTTSAFKDKTGRLAKIMAGLAVSTALIVFLVGYFGRGFEFSEILLVTIATMVSSIPEGLPVVISIVLAIGARQMAKKNAIIREFTATEMLGSVTTILTDKTGTLTESLLTVKKMFINEDLETTVSGQGYETTGAIETEEGKLKYGQDARFDKMALIAAYCNTAKTEVTEEEDGKKTAVTGDPTEAALLVLSRKADISGDGDELKVIDDLPFHSEAKFRASLVEYPDGKREIFAVGAPERMLDKSTKIITSGGSKALNDDLRKKISEITDSYTEEAMRVVSLAYKPADDNKEEVEQEDVDDLTWTGLTGIIDPPRAGVKEAIRAARDAGIRVIMVTGDHKKTAFAIAEDVGIADEGEKALSAEEIAAEEEEFARQVAETNVFARVDPDTKLRIAEHLQNSGELVGMTGDGVNDAPALKRADVGIAMGVRGTDVAKDAAQIVLSDDNFSSIVAAIEQGRIVFKNVRNTSFFLITTNFAATMTIVTCIAIGLPLPLLAAQILFVNLVTDGVMDIALATEPGHGNVMKQKPYGRDEPILNRTVLPYLVLVGGLMITLTVLVFQHFLPEGEETARAGAFLAIAMTQLFNAFNMRAPDESVFKIGLTTNRWILLAFGVSLALQVIVIKMAFFKELFSFGTITYAEIGIIFLLSSSILILGEAWKQLRKKLKWDI